MVKAIIAFVLISFTTTTSRAQDFEYNVLYDSDKSEIQDRFQSEIRELFENISAESLLQITLIGHTDSDASEEYNLDLSKKRVQGVKDFLTDQGIPDNLISSSFVGESEPRESNTTAIGKEANRRVQIKFVLKPIPQERDKVVEEVDECLDDTIISLPGGTKYKINKCFYFENPDCVKIKEYFTAQSLADEGLTTMSDDGDPLISGGMMDYDICDGIEIQVFVPKRGLGCDGDNMSRWESDEEGAWVQVSSQVLPTSTIGGQVYFQLGITGIGRLNLDKVLTFSSLPPKTRFKRKTGSGLHIQSVSLYCDCPLTGASQGSTRNKGKKVVVTRNCCPSMLVDVTGYDKDGNALEFETRPLEELEGNTYMGSCATDERKKFWFIRTRNKQMHRKYKLSKKDFN